MLGNQTCSALKAAVNLKTRLTLRGQTSEEAEARLPRKCDLLRLVTQRKITLCLSMLFLLSLTGCGEKAVATISTESEAIEIIGVLRENGFKAEKRPAGEKKTEKWVVVLDEGYFGDGDLGSSLQVLHNYGLPRPEDPPVKSDGLITTETTRRLQEQQRIRADIERQLRSLPNVMSAIVTLVLPPPDQAYRIQPQPATASALVVYKGDKLFTAEQVQSMVARSVAGLNVENVSVTMSQQMPRPVPRSELNARRRANLLLAAGIGLIIILGFLLAVVFLQMRRQRAELSELRAAHEPAPEALEEAGASAPALAATGVRPATGVRGEGTGSAALPPASSSEG